MIDLRLGRYALGAIAMVTMLAGCGGSQVAPAGVPSAVTAAHGKSWMLPEAKGENLLYVLKASGRLVKIYSYPGSKLVGQLTGFEDIPTGLCADEQGDVFVTDEDNDSTELPGNHIVKFAHGGTNPIASLNDQYPPWSCSVDPTTGNLAATNWLSRSVAIYPNAQGNPTYISTALSHTYYATYDSGGNLFVSGNTGPSSYGLVELLSGRSSFKQVTLNEAIRLAALQWNDGYLEASYIADFSKMWYLYRIEISGNKGKVVDTTVLDLATKLRTPPRQPLILGNSVLAGSNSLQRWRYPSGGKAVKTLALQITPASIVLSVVPSGNRIHR